MDFKIKQTVVVVPRENYYEALKYGLFKLGTVTRTEKDKSGRTYFVAALGTGEEVTNVIGGPYEFNSIDYVKSTLIRFAHEARADAAFYLELAASLDAWYLQ